jgi:hypothetical protein
MYEGLVSMECCQVKTPQWTRRALEPGAVEAAHAMAAPDSCHHINSFAFSSLQRRHLPDIPLPITELRSPNSDHVQSGPEVRAVPFYFGMR